MDVVEVAQAFGALAHPVRLRAATLLAGRSDGLAAGQLASELKVRQNTLSSHIAVLERANLVFGQRDGRYIIYRFNQHMARSVVAHMQQWVDRP